MEWMDRKIGMVEYENEVKRSPIITMGTNRMGWKNGQSAWT